MSTRSFRASFFFDMRGNVTRTARRFGDAVRRLGDRADAQFTRIGRAAEYADRRLNRGLIRGAQVGTAALVAGAALAARHMFTLEERLERLGVAAGKSTEEMNDVRNAVNDVAKAADIRIDPGELLGAMEAFTEMTGDFDLADRIKREMALAIQATGSAGVEIGALMASIAQKFDIDTAEGMAEALDVLVIQGKMGAIELKNLARLGPKVFSAFRRQGQGGIAGLAEAGGLLQIFKEAVGSPEEAATVFENVMNNLYAPEKLKKLRKTVGVSPDGADGELLGPMELAKRIVASAKGDTQKLAKLYDAESLRGLSILAAAYRDTGAFKQLDDYAAVRGDGSVLAADSARLAKTGNASGTAFATNVRDRIEDNLMEPLKALTESMNALVDDGVTFTLDDAANIAIGGAIALGGVKAGLYGLRSLGGRGRGGGAGGGVPDLPGGIGVQRVFVTNWPARMMFGGDGGVDPGDAKRGKGGRRGGGRTGRGGRWARNAGRWGGRLSLLAGGAYAGLEIMDFMANGDTVDPETWAELPEASRGDAALAAAGRRRREVDAMTHPVSAGPRAPGPALMSGYTRETDILEALLRAEEEQRDELAEMARRQEQAIDRQTRLLAQLVATRGDLRSAPLDPRRGPQ